MVDRLSASKFWYTVVLISIVFGSTHDEILIQGTGKHKFESINSIRLPFVQTKV